MLSKEEKQDAYSPGKKWPKCFAPAKAQSIVLFDRLKKDECRGIVAVENLRVPLVPDRLTNEHDQGWHRPAVRAVDGRHVTPPIFDASECRSEERRVGKECRN